MMGLLKIYLQQFRTTLASFTQYRAAIFIWMIAHVLEPVVYLAVWTVVSRSTKGTVGGFASSDFSAYFILMMLVNHVTYTWIMWEFEYRVRYGSLSFQLLRPLHPIHTDIVDNIASKLITLPMITVVAVILALIFKPVFHLVPWAVVAFFPALILAFIMRFIFEWMLALAAFWTTRVTAVNQGYYVAALFLTGQMAPLALLPRTIQVIASLLPFRWMISFPVELILGKLTPGEAAIGIVAQIVWLLIGLVLVKKIWHGGVRIYSAVGA